MTSDIERAHLLHHEPEMVTVYDYGNRVIAPGDLFYREDADKEFEGYTVNTFMLGSTLMLMVEEPEPALRKIWHIACCFVHCRQLAKALCRNNGIPWNPEWDKS